MSHVSASVSLAGQPAVAVAVGSLLRSTALYLLYGARGTYLQYRGTVAASGGQRAACALRRASLKATGKAEAGYLSGKPKSPELPQSVAPVPYSSRPPVSKGSSASKRRRTFCDFSRPFGVVLQTGQGAGSRGAGERVKSDCCTTVGLGIPVATQ